MQQNFYSSQGQYPEISPAVTLPELSPSNSTAQLGRSQKLPSPPTLPEHLDELLDLPWTPEASRLVDCWLWYGEREFELGGES